MNAQNTIFAWIWKLGVCTIAYIVGIVLGGALTMGLGLDLPVSPGEVDETAQMLTLIPGGLLFSIGLAAMAVGLVGRWWQRWLILAVFLYAINGIGNSIEASIFTTLGGTSASMAIFILPSLLCAMAVALLFPAPAATSLSAKLAEFRARREPTSLAGRAVLAILAFPVIYFFFGLVVSPIVVPYYNELEFLVIPPLSTLLPILCFRSALLLLVSLPIIIGWNESRARMIIGLGLGHAAAVGLGGLAQATFFPDVLRWAHGAEIFVDSMVYAWVLAALFVPKARAHAGVAMPG